MSTIWTLSHSPLQRSRSYGKRTDSGTTSLTWKGNKNQVNTAALDILMQVKYADSLTQHSPMNKTHLFAPLWQNCPLKIRDGVRKKLSQDHIELDKYGPVGKVLVSLNSNKNNGYLTRRPIYIFDHIALNYARNEKHFKQKLQRKSRHILCSIFFSPENHAVHDNVEIYCRARQAIYDNMAHAHCTLFTQLYKHTQNM